MGRATSRAPAAAGRFRLTVGSRVGLSTRRAAVLAVVVCALALTLAVPLRTYVAQRQEVAATVAEQQELAAEVAALQSELDQLQDPGQVEAQARARLRYVMPGETPYQVQLPGAVADAVEATEAPEPEPAPWYSALWSTVTASGAP